MKSAQLLKHDVEEALLYEPSIRAEKIGVSVNNGVIELDGHVDSFYEKWAVEDATLRVTNVASIASEIIVDLPFESKQTDESIALAATNQLTWNVQVPDTVKIKVVDGQITLQGTTPWRYQRQEAERSLRSLLGVRNIINEIDIRPELVDFNVKTKIEHALKRDAQIGSDRICVETSGNTVTLTGSVCSLRERRDAEHAAFDAPGVANVENLIDIMN